MFNGLIRTLGRSLDFDGKRLLIASDLKASLGDSIAVNGACLSVVEIQNNAFVVELSSQSAKVLALENYKPGELLHLEEALKFGEKIHGHLMQGHIDALGRIERINKLDVGVDFFIELPLEIMELMAHKGSVGVDGVSLTISAVYDRGIGLSIIPITLKDTLFSHYKLNRRVHIESDLFAKYTKQILKFQNLESKNQQNKLTWDEAELYTRMF